MAAKEFFCDPCSEEVKSIAAVKYCSDCEEHLCEECAESHLRFKAFESHHLIDLSSAESRIPSSANMRCEIHTDVQLDFYCSHHDTVCCRVCLPDRHISCKDVLPLDFASKDVRNSTLLSDAFRELKNITETFGKLLTNRENNIKLLAQSTSSITKQIRDFKEQLYKHLDNIEQRLIDELASVVEKTISTMKTVKTEIFNLDASLKPKKDELDFLQNHGSNNQLFLALQKHIAYIRKTDAKLQEIVSVTTEIDIKFEGNINLEVKSLGSIMEITRPCNITYTTYKSQQAQGQPDTVKLLTEFKRDGQVKLKSGEQYNIEGIAVTAENKLFICNFQSSCSKVYIYKECKIFEDEITFDTRPFDVSVIPCSHRAVVTLPHEKCVQFINTTNNTKERKVELGEMCFGVTASKERLYLGGDRKILILGTDGSEITSITTEKRFIFSLCYNNNDRILIRQDGGLHCIYPSGEVVYQFTISGNIGVAVDRNGDMYLSGYFTNEIQRWSSDGTLRDIVLTESDGITFQRFLSFNHDFTKLFVVSNQNSVLIYNNDCGDTSINP